MITILVYLVIATALFVSVLISKRRFGLLGLALSAGSLISGIMSYDASFIASGLGIRSGLLSSSVISALIIMLPVVILFFRGYTYKTLIGRLVGASLFTLLALAFLIEPLGAVLMVQGLGADVYDWFVSSRSTIIGFGLIIAITDLFLTKPIKLSDKKREH